MNDNLSSKRYAPPTIDLNDKTHSHTLIIEKTGFNKTVLEIGTSTGYIGKSLTERGNRVTGIEIDNEAGSIAQQYYERMIIGDVETLNLDELLSHGSFDVIMCGDVLEHLKTPSSVLKKLRKFLKPDGYIVVSLPNFCHGDVLLNLLHGDFHYTSIGLLDETHLHFFGLKNIYLIFTDCGYTIKDLQTTTCAVGATELKIEGNKIPRDLLKFIQSLPDSGVYQYIFSAYPSDCVTLPVIPEVEINQLFFDSLKELRNEVQIPLEEKINTLNHSLADMNAQVQSLDQALSEKDQWITGVSAHVQDIYNIIKIKNQQIADANVQLQLFNTKLSAIENSIVWQFTMKFHKNVIEKLLPHNTRRRRYYDLVRDGGKILVTKGFAVFCHSVKCHFRKKDLTSDISNYQKWIIHNEPASDQLDQLIKQSQKLSYRPKISIITPVWNIDEKWLRLAIESVIKQTYDNWELCIVDGGSINPNIPKILKEYAKKDQRIKVIILTENQGIAQNSNAAFNLATGDYVGFLDHDDKLAPFALYEVVNLLNINKNLSFIYSDEDNIDDKEIRKNPILKTDWSPELFLSCNYLCHFSVIKKSIMDEIGGFHLGYDGAQDYDLFLRVIEKIDAKNIAHIPKILYHWRIIPSSVTSSGSAKPYAFENGRKALSDAMHRRNIAIDGVIDGPWLGSYRILYALIGKPKISIIIPNKDKSEVLKKCITSILDKTIYQNYEIIIVDNQSTEKDTFRYYDTIKNSSKIIILDYDKPFNFSAINNFAATHAEGEYLVFLNNDTEVITPEWLSAMLEHAQQSHVGAVGAKLLYPDNTIQHCGVILGIGVGHYFHVAGHPWCRHPDQVGYGGRIWTICNYSAVTGACMMMKKEIFDSVGGFDEKLVIAFNDVDLCLKIRSKGFFIVYTPYSQLYHYESLTRGYETTKEKLERFLGEIGYVHKKWGDVIDKGDPFYNPNLAVDRGDYALDYTGCDIK